MKIFLDSSFFFPLISISVKEFNKQLISDLLKDKRFTICRSELVTFELSVKGTKYVNEDLLKIEDVIDGLNTLVYDSIIQVIMFYHSEIQVLTAFLRKNHSDFIDCLTLASAIYNSDAFITLDRSLEKNSTSIWNEKLTEINEEFQVFLWKDFKKQFLLEK